MVLMAMLALISCELNDDEDFPDPVYNTPVINIEDGSTIELGVGQFVNFPTIEINGSVAIQNFNVSESGNTLLNEDLDGTSGNITTSFQFRIPEEWFDTTRDIVFSATDTEGNSVSASVSLTVSDITPQYNIEDVTLNGQNFRRITGIINFNETLDDSFLWIISGEVEVAQQTTLTILEGTQIYAETEDTRLQVNQLGMVDWQGTSTNPIVFNALANAPGQGAGSEDRGQWSGIEIEGSGGNDNSGIVRYVRLMYPGSDDDSFQFTNVGDGTVVEYIQIYRNGDNGFRVNEGTINLKYLVSTNPVDGEAGIRWDDSWVGAGQFWVVNMLDTGDGIQGREGAGILSNITITGVGFNDPSQDADGGGFRIRNGGSAQIYNAVVTGVDRSLRFSNGSEETVANGESLFANSASFENDEDDGSGFHSSADFFNPTDNDYIASFNNSVTPFLITDAYVGTDTTNSRPAGALDPFFTDVNYVGAVEAGNDWTIGWTVNIDGSLRQ